MSSHARNATLDIQRNVARSTHYSIVFYAIMNGYKGPICAVELGVDYNDVLVNNVLVESAECWRRDVRD